MSEEENVYKFNFSLREAYKYAMIPENTEPSAVEAHTSFWEKVVAGLQEDQASWAELSGKYGIPMPADGRKYKLHAWLPLDVEQSALTAEMYNLTIELV